MDTYMHPKLGELYHEDVDWQSDQAAVSFCHSPIEVCLADGSDDGPSEAAMSGYEWVESHWEQVRELIQDQAFEFYEPYADAVDGVPKFESPSQLWKTEIVLGLRMFSRDEFSVTLRFEWQQNDDPHEVTFYVEGGKCESHSVDG